MKNPSIVWSIWKYAAVGALLIVSTQSIADDIDDINAGIRARAAAERGKPPEELHIYPSGTQRDEVKAQTKKSGKCSFSYYFLGDDKGKVLADAARDECYRNEELKGEGKGDQISNEAYQRWREHREMTKRAPVQSKQMRCRTDYAGGLICQ